MGGFPQRRDRSATAAAAAVQRGGGKNDGFMDELHFHKVGSPRHPGKNSCKLLAFCSEWGGFYANYNLLFLLLLHTYSHCSYLDIYISRKIRLCVVDLERKFQTNLQAKLPLLFTHCCCYSKELTYLNCNFCIKPQFKHFNSLEKQQQCVKSRWFDKFSKK